MNSNEKFEQIYSRIVENNAEDLESSRYRAKNETVRNITIITIVIIRGNKIMTLPIVIIIILFVLVILIFAKYNTLTKLKLKVKQSKSGMKLLKK